MHYSLQYCNRFNLVIASDFNSMSHTREYYSWLLTCGNTYSGKISHELVIDLKTTTVFSFFTTNCGTVQKNAAICNR